MTMILYPAMTELNKSVPNRYLLVNVVARRARQIAEKADVEGIRLTEKPVTSAITKWPKGSSAKRAFTSASKSKKE